MIDDAISGVTFVGLRFVVLTKNPFEFCGFVAFPAVIAGADGTDNKAGHIAVTDCDFCVTPSLVFIRDELVASVFDDPFDF